MYGVRVRRVVRAALAVPRVTVDGVSYGRHPGEQARPRRPGFIVGHGRLLHAETKYFQITDHENRIAPEIVIAYALRTPNLLRGGYTPCKPGAMERARKLGWPLRFSTTGNALFWSPGEPLEDVNGTPYFPPHKKPECRNRTFTAIPG